MNLSLWIKGIVIKTFLLSYPKDFLYVVRRFHMGQALCSPPMEGPQVRRAPQIASLRSLVQ